MLSRITRLLILCFLIGLSIYFVSINSDEVSVSVSGQNSVKASTGVIVLFSFAFGLIVATIAAGILAIKGYFREQGFLRRERYKALQDEAILQGRSLVASGELKRAKLSFEKLISKDHKNALLRLELSSVFEKMKDPMSALKILDEARVEFPNNEEVLFKTASLHESLGNLTASIDTLALLISKKASPLAIRTARDLSMQLNRFEDALLYNDRLKEAEGNSPDTKEMMGTIKANILIRDLAHKHEDLTAALMDHVMIFEKCVVAFKELAKLKLSEGKADEAAQCLQRAFRANRDPALIREARNIWFSHGYRDKTVSSIKTWVREAEGKEEFDARLELTKTYLLIGQDSDASYEIDLLEREPFAQSYDAKREIAIIKAIIAYRSRDTLRSIEAFREVESLELEASPKTALLIQEKIETR